MHPLVATIIIIILSDIIKLNCIISMLEILVQSLWSCGN